MKCPKCGYKDEWRSSRFDFEREVLEKKHMETLGDEERQIYNSLYHQIPWPRKQRPTIERNGFAYTITGTGCMWRMPLEVWKDRGWSPKNYFDSTNKTWTVARKK